jgi:two-component system heavy metal sensor histidine kinase CusS
MLFYSLSTIGLLAAVGIFLYPTFLKIMEKVNGSGASYITSECYEKIIITLLVSSLISILFGHFVARKGLHRMREFENTMEKITANSLHERINLNEWPKELKNFGSKFNTMLDRIETSFIQLSQFSSDIAHELRTPINNLCGITELALSKENGSTEYRNILEKYMDEYQHLSKLIENLLFLARSDHGQLVLKKEAINVREEILKICDYYQAMAEEKNIELICYGDATIAVDVLLFKRAINNLISNALRHTPINGKVEINIALINQQLNIIMTDTGEGISHEHIYRVFDRFYRVDSSRSSQSGGIGLGLAIVKSIIDLHQGKITLQSQLNVGTTVSLHLPCSG